ncbi:MAG: manganese efflux pump [Oscillospiraceae bacterium]|nr:manganese efflux pump [Oscillospiraceae bacterium]
MGFFEIFLSGIGLSMDAFAVSVTNGLICKKVRVRDAIKIGLFFGIAQGLMPLIGYFLGKTFASYVERFDHWIAFLLLAFIGGKMIIDVFSGEEEKGFNLDFKSLFIQAIATSIDALVLGVTFSSLGDINIFSAVLLIAGITFTFCVLGTYLGRFVGEKLGKYALLAGGIILIGLGAKILIEHLFF